jgi:hypothetical protein
MKGKNFNDWGGVCSLAIRFHYRLTAVTVLYEGMVVYSGEVGLVTTENSDGSPGLCLRPSLAIL